VDDLLHRGHFTLLVLAALATGPAHGYALIQRLRDTSEGAFELPEGTLYPLLHRLEDEALVASRWTQVDGRKRREYRLTQRGRKALAAQENAWRSFAAGIERVIARPA
jgi:DNA-binding PadR family transcriptional regulator